MNTQSRQTTSTYGKILENNPKFRPIPIVPSPNSTNSPVITSSRPRIRAMPYPTWNTVFYQRLFYSIIHPHSSIDGYANEYSNQCHPSFRWESVMALFYFPSILSYGGYYLCYALYSMGGRYLDTCLFLFPYNVHTTIDPLSRCKWAKNKPS